jgi:hypothetical protein
MTDAPYRSSARDDLGPVVSEHRPRALHAAWMGLLIAFCVGVLVLLVLTLGRDEDALDVAKRAGMGLLFLVATGFLGHSLWREMGTRVTVGRDGLRHEVRGKVVVARWADIGSVQIVRQNGAVKSLTLHVGSDELIVTSALSDFRALTDALVSRAILPPDFRA